MITPEAIWHFVDQQKKLLRRTYDDAWQRGVDSYRPDTDPQTEPTLPLKMAVVGLVGKELLDVRKRYKYVPPTVPDPLRRAVALAPSYKGLNQMGTELAGVMDGTQPEVFANQGDIAQAVSDWADSNAWRLSAGDSVAWAGEQAGVAEAANNDGQMMYGWSSVGDLRVCMDCEMLASYPPMPLGDWPTSPGAGDTLCSVGCRCTWDTYDSSLFGGGVPDLTSEQEAHMNDLIDRRNQTLADMMPDAAYLD